MGAISPSGRCNFLSTDPLGHEASLDLYSYANGDPVNFLDPTGRQPGRGTDFSHVLTPGEFAGAFIDGAVEGFSSPEGMVLSGIGLALTTGGASVPYQATVAFTSTKLITYGTGSAIAEATGNIDAQEVLASGPVTPIQTAAGVAGAVIDGVLSEDGDGTQGFKAGVALAGVSEGAVGLGSKIKNADNLKDTVEAGVEAIKLYGDVENTLDSNPNNAETVAPLNPDC